MVNWIVTCKPCPATWTSARPLPPQPQFAEHVEYIIGLVCAEFGIKKEQMRRRRAHSSRAVADARRVVGGILFSLFNMRQVDIAHIINCYRPGVWRTLASMREFLEAGVDPVVEVYRRVYQLTMQRYPRGAQRRRMGRPSTIKRHLNTF